MDDLTLKEMIGQDLLIQMLRYSQLMSKGILTVEEQNSQLTSVQSQEKKLNVKRMLLRMMLLVQVHTSLNFLAMFQFTHLVRDLTQASETRTTSSQLKGMVQDPDHTSYHLVLKLVNRHPIEK
jgi:hypothetical protein